MQCRLENRRSCTIVSRKLGFRKISREEENNVVDKRAFMFSLKNGYCVDTLGKSNVRVKKLTNEGFRF